MLVVIGIVAVIIVINIFVYNRLVYLRNKTDETFKAVDVFLEQRFDTLTKLAKTVANYAKHERGTFERVAELRSGYQSMSSSEKVRASNELDRLMNKMYITVENYPDLKASQNYLHLQHTINDLEENLSASRRSYNARVNQLNTFIQSFPTNISAKLFGFQKREMLVIEDYKRADVDMDALLGG